MRLSELNPELATEGCEPGVAYLHIDCPHCRSPHFIVVKIATVQEPGSTHVWTWNGETDFEKLTLTPSLKAYGHWHGHITNGEVTTV